MSLKPEPRFRYGSWTDISVCRHCGYTDYGSIWMDGLFGHCPSCGEDHDILSDQLRVRRVSIRVWLRYKFSHWETRDGTELENKEDFKAALTKHRKRGRF